MRDELYIDGNLMHVEGNIVLNRQVGKAADMGAILQGYSYTVQLPKTPENLFNIGFSHIPNVDTVYPHSEHPATLIREGITLFDDGVALIKSVGETIEVQLTWGINKQLSVLGNYKLRDMRLFDGLYMKWNKDFRDSENEYFKWVCKLDNEPRYQYIHHLRPAVSVIWLFDNLCGNHVINPKYRAEIEKLWMMLPSAKGDEIIASRLKFNLTGQAMSNDMLGSFPHIKLNTIYTQYSYDLRFMLGDTNAEPHFVRLPLGGRYRIKGTVTPVNPGSGSSFLFGLASKDKVVAMEKPTFDLTENFKPNQTNFDEYIFVAENQDVMFGITDIVNIGSFSINLVITYEPEKAQDYANTNYLLDYPIKENLPDITCVQFVKSVMALFGLYSQHVEGVLTFFSVDDILGNKEQAIDLTDQLISNSDKLEYSLGLTQNNALKWAEDDLVEKGYGDHTFSADTYEKAENVVFQQPYAATKDRCILYAKDAQGEYELLKTEKPRLLSLAGTETWLAIGLQPQFPSTQSTFSTFTFEPLKYSTLYGKYWQGYNGVFATQPRVCTRKAYLSSLFVQKLDFSIPVYAEGNYYMLVSVRNYQQSGLAELELALIDGVEVQPGARLTNTLLESAGVPIKFEASKMALYQRTGGEPDGKLIRELDESLELTATAMFAVDNGSGPAKKVSASKVAEYIGKNHKHEISDVNQLKTELERRLRNDVEDTAEKKITFKEGIEIGKYSSGAFGSGGKAGIDEYGSSYIDIDKLNVRKEATFNVLNIHSLKASGGEVLHSDADMKCIRVEDKGDYYRCYFDNDEGSIFNEFAVYDQARCQKFDGKNLKYYWRLVIGVGADYIDLSKNICDGSSIPDRGDEIIQLGNRTDKTRQSAILISVYSKNSPSITQYDGIDSFSLVGKEVNVIGRESKFSGKVTFAAGSSGYHNIEGLQEEIDAAKDFATDLVNGISIGSVNILMNSGFTGDYTPEKLNANSILSDTSQMYSNQLKHWTYTGSVSAIEKTTARSKFAVSLNGEISQPVDYIKNDNYVASFRATGSSLKINDEIIPVTATDARYTVQIKASGNMFKLSGKAIVYDLKLERGSVATDWSPNPNDNPATLDKFNAINYITKAIQEGNTEIMGGLILSSMIQLGMWKNGKMDKVTSGVSGIAMDEEDPAYWAGGDLAAAIRAILDPTDPSGAAAVITHFGKAIFNNIHARGHIEATSGKFTGDIESNVDGNRIVISAKERKVLLYNQDGHITGFIGFIQDDYATLPYVRLNRLDPEGNTVAWTRVFPESITCGFKDTENINRELAMRKSSTSERMTITGDLPRYNNAGAGEMYIDDTGADNFYQVRIKK